MLNKFKAKMANIVLKFISVEEKLTFMFLETSLKNIKQIVILPSVNTVTKYLVGKLQKKSFHGLIVNGLLNNVEVSVIQTNMGCPSTAVIMECLKNSDCKVAIRIDYCGGLKNTNIQGEESETGLIIGSIVIPKCVFLTDGNSMQYLQKYAKEIAENPLFHSQEIPNESNWQYPNLNGKYWSVECADKLYQIFFSALTGRNKRNQKDILWSSDAIFCETINAISLWREYECTSVDMESSAIYLLGALFNLPVISLNCVSNLSDAGDEFNSFMTNKIDPGILQGLDDVFKLLYNNLPQIRKQILEQK